MPEPSGFLAVDELDAAATLEAVEAGVRERRALEVRELELVLHWADLHGHDPRDEGQPGGPRLVRLGGTGTPKVVDVSICELAVARGQHTLSVRSMVADGLDARHRLVELYTAFREGRVDLWVVRKVASMTRNLDQAAVALVDRAVAEALAEGAGRVLAIAEAKVMEADLEAARAEGEAALRRRYVAVTRTGEDGLRHVVAPVAPADGVFIDAMVDRVADALDARRDLIPDVPTDATRDELRSVALGWLAHPEDVVALLAGEVQPRGNAARTKVVLYVHLHQAALHGAAAVARVEELGPVLVDQLAGLLGHSRVTLAPVIDLNDIVSVNGYEHPEAVKERTRLRTVGDVFPHAVTTSRKTEMDHPDPFEANGPPGQTGDLNAAPLGRRHHRAKTHLAYDARQIGLARYLWRTPHGRERLVDPRGTHELDPARAAELARPGALHAALDEIRAARALGSDAVS